jgi:ABC-type nitrate/sulfonate/bicarbonate transport system ATPase subunit
VPALVRDADDRESLLLALRNLVTNAIQWSPPGQRVQVHMAAREEGLEVTVDDAGPGVPKPERERIALEQLRLVRLEKFAGAYPHHLSGGMQQRVAIARALAYNPGVLLMDEPFAALDALTREEMQRLLAEVWRETKKTVIYVTHNVAEAVYLADRVVVMSPHPGTVRKIVSIRLPRPRDALSVEFLAHQKELLAHLTRQEEA